LNRESEEKIEREAKCTTGFAGTTQSKTDTRCGLGKIETLAQANPSPIHGRQTVEPPHGLHNVPEVLIIGALACPSVDAIHVLHEEEAIS